MTGVLDRLGLPTGRVVTDHDLLEQYRRDNAALAPAGLPQAAVVARSVADVQETLAFANDQGIPVVTRGAGSGLSGGANAVDGCIVLVTTDMNRIVDINRADLVARVEPGVINGELKDEAAKVDLFYPPDPASYEFSTLGGNIATNAGGLCCVKYGVTRDYVASVDVALADGTLLHTGTASRKSTAGYDFTGLMVGSEGTLGVIVGATLRLVPKPEAAATVVATFPSLDQLGVLPGRLAEAGITPSLLEVVDNLTINRVEDHYPMGLDRSLGALVIAQSDSPDREQQAARIAQIAAELDATETFHTADPIEAEMLLQARRLAYTALEQSEGLALLDDVAVPLSRITTLVAEISRISDRHQIPVATFGHLGDGNLHPTLLYNPQDKEEEQRARQAFDEIVYAALDLDGTVTGEHGVGNLKTPHLADELDQTALRLQAEVRSVFDPSGILNPGKAIASPASPRRDAESVEQGIR